MEDDIKQIKRIATLLDKRLSILENRLNGLTNDPRQVEVIRKALSGTNFVMNNIEINGTLNHDGASVGFYSTAPTGQAAKISGPSGGATVDAEARSAINSIISVLEGVGLTLDI